MLRRLVPPAIAHLALAPMLAHADTLQVGSDKPYTTIAAAVQAAGPGDVVEIDPGDYVDDIVVIDAGDITLRGVGDARAHVSSTSNIGNGKGIILINAGAQAVTIEHLEFSGATVADNNGAGIRMQGTALVVRDCHFHDNQNGILGGEDATVEIYDSEFDHNGNPGSGQEHNVYIGTAASLVFQGNYSHHAYSGHTLKSRAQVNHILYNRLMDEQDGTSSYLVDLPQGGLSILVGNLIEQGPVAENHGTIVNYKGEGGTNDDLRLFMVNNTIVNDNAAAPGFVVVHVADEVVLRNNLFVGAGTMLQIDGGTSPAVTDEGNLQTDMPGLVDQAGFDYHLADGSAAIDAGVAPGSADGFDLTPSLHYLHPASTEPRPEVDAIDVGAYEFGMGPPVGESGSEGGADSGTGDPTAGTGDTAGTGGSASASGGSATAGGSADGSESGSGEGSAGGTNDGDGGGCGCTHRDAPPHLALAGLVLLVGARRRRMRR